MAYRDTDMTVTDQRDKIRQRYKGVNSSELEVIPALPKTDVYNSDRELRVAVYARVSTGDPPSDILI